MKKLVKQEIKDILALTPMQEGILFHYLKDPDKGYYFEQLYLCLRGEIHLPHFEKAWHRVTAANEMLRTCFRWEKLDKPIQIVLREHRPHIQYHDLLHSEASAEEREKRLEQIKITDRETPFDLGNVPFRIILCKTASQHYQMIVSSHHILYDGWSSGIILKEFFEAYSEAGLTGIPIPTAPKPCFKNFVSWLRHRDPEQEKEFWTNYLRDFDTATELRLKEPAGEEKAKTGMQQYELAVTGSLKQNLETFVKERHVTTAAVLYTAWGLLLQKYADRDDVVFGTTVAGRPAAVKQVEEIVGLFINTIPLRLQTAPGDTVAALVAETDKQIQNRAPYENTSLVDINGYSDMDDGELLFDSIVVIENYPIDNALVPASTGLTIDSYGMYEMTHFDLTLTIELLTKINIKLAWNRAKFETGTMENMVRHFNTILTGMLEDPGQRTDGLELLSPEEKRQLIYDFNDTATDYPSDKTIAQLIKEQTHRTPFRTALAGRENLSFAELDRRASRLARLLLENGVRRGHIVAFMMNRSNDILITMLGILKAGGAYLPIDADYSAQRAAYMLEDSSAVLFISNLETPPPLAGIPVIRPEAAREAIEISNAPEITASPEDPAYILYTSGSTGKPKGVMIENRPFVNFIKGITDIIPFNTTDRILSLTTVSFDIFGLESLLALSQGSTVILGNEEEQRDAFLGERLMERENITIFQATPSRLQVFIQSPNLDNGFKRLRSLIIGGEALPPALLEKLEALTIANIYNVYGPTETTVWSTIRQVNGNRRLNIGKPIANTTVYILNRWGLHQPVGAAGELVIGGHGLARGYLNRPELTAEKFNQNFQDYHDDQDKKIKADNRLYRTGDLARRLPDGNIQFVGRIDMQVKIRGFCIELGEIESKLLTHPDIKEALVMTAGEPGAGGETELAAYFSASSEIEPGKLRDYLSRTLPMYMIPSYFVQIDALPLTSSGKTDTRALPRPGQLTGGIYTAPRNEIETQLAAIWHEVLGIPADENPSVSMMISSNWVDTR